MSCLVIIPDFFDGKGADISWAPMDTEEKQKSMMSFLTTKANPPEVLQRLLAVMKESSSVYANVQNWAALGLCWGGKVSDSMSLVHASPVSKLTSYSACRTCLR